MPVTKKRPQESPEVEAMLAKLSSTMMFVAPTSHMFAETAPRHTDDIRTKPAVGAELKRTSNLKSVRHDTVSDVLERFSGGRTGSATELANQLRFARPDDAPAGVTGGLNSTSGLRGTGHLKPDGTFVPFQLGTGTISKGELSSTYGAPHIAPPDAEVRRLEEKLSKEDGIVGEVARRTLGTTKLSDSTAKPAKQHRDTVGALINASGAAPIFESEYTKSHHFTPQMYETVKQRDMTHALKNDEERRYAEEKIKFDRMLGAGSKPRAAATGKPK